MKVHGSFPLGGLIALVLGALSAIAALVCALVACGFAIWKPESQGGWWFATAGFVVVLVIAGLRLWK